MYTIKYIPGIYELVGTEGYGKDYEGKDYSESDIFPKEDSWLHVLQTSLEWRKDSEYESFEALIDQVWSECPDVVLLSDHSHDWICKNRDKDFVSSNFIGIKCSSERNLTERGKLVQIKRAYEIIDGHCPFDVEDD